MQRAEPEEARSLSFGITTGSAGGLLQLFPLFLNSGCPEWLRIFGAAKGAGWQRVELQLN